MTTLRASPLCAQVTSVPAMDVTPRAEALLAAAVGAAVGAKVGVQTAGFVDAMLRPAASDAFTQMRSLTSSVRQRVPEESDSVAIGLNFKPPPDLVTEHPLAFDASPPVRSRVLVSLSPSVLPPRSPLAAAVSHAAMSAAQLSEVSSHPLFAMSVYTRVAPDSSGMSWQGSPAYGSK